MITVGVMVVLLLSNCNTYFPDEPILVRDEVTGVRPVYLDSALAHTLTFAPCALPGGFGSFQLDGFIVQLTPYEGLSFSTRDSASSTSVGSLLVPGVTRIFDRNGNTLSFDNYGDSITIQLFGINDYAILDRTPGIREVDPYDQLRSLRFLLPQEVFRDYNSNIYLECYDASRGFVRRWEVVELQRPQCLI